jgi:hypothetical protein
MKDLHHIIVKSGRKRPSFGSNIGQPSSDESLQKLYNLTKLQPYHNLTVALQANEDYKNNIANYEHEQARLRSENWLIPKNEIQGLTGYICRRCNTLAYEWVRNIGYDKTIASKHICDENRVRNIQMVSIRPADIWTQCDAAARFIIDGLNQLMPGPKYMIATDVSKTFDTLEELMDPSLARMLIGIPDRYYLYTVRNFEKIPWLVRVVNNRDTKVSVNENEVRDFIRRVQSTFAIFETTIRWVTKRYRIEIIA